MCIYIYIYIHTHAYIYIYIYMHTHSIVCFIALQLITQILLTNVHSATKQSFTLSPKLITTPTAQ